MKSYKEISNYFENDKFDLEHEAQMIQAKILAPFLSKIREEGIKQEILAKRMKVSQPYLSQVFHGDKNLSMSTIAKLQEALDVVLETPSIKDLPKYLDNYYDKDVDKVSTNELEEVFGYSVLSNSISENKWSDELLKSQRDKGKKLAKVIPLNVKVIDPNPNDELEYKSV